MEKNEIPQVFNNTTNDLLFAILNKEGGTGSGGGGGTGGGGEPGTSTERIKLKSAVPVDIMKLADGNYDIDAELIIPDFARGYNAFHTDKENYIENYNDARTMLQDARTIASGYIYNVSVVTTQATHNEDVVYLREVTLGTRIAMEISIGEYFWFLSMGETLDTMEVALTSLSGFAYEQYLRYAVPRLIASGGGSGTGSAEPTIITSDTPVDIMALDAGDYLINAPLVIPDYADAYNYIRGDRENYISYYNDVRQRVERIRLQIPGNTIAVSVMLTKFSLPEGTYHIKEVKLRTKFEGDGLIGDCFHFIAVGDSESTMNVVLTQLQGIAYETYIGYAIPRLIAAAGSNEPTKIVSETPIDIATLEDGEYVIDGDLLLPEFVDAVNIKRGDCRRYCDVYDSLRLDLLSLSSYARGDFFKVSVTTSQISVADGGEPTSMLIKKIIINVTIPLLGGSGGFFEFTYMSPVSAPADYELLLTALIGFAYEQYSIDSSDVFVTINAQTSDVWTPVSGQWRAIMTIEDSERDLSYCKHLSFDAPVGVNNIFSMQAFDPNQIYVYAENDPGTTAVIFPKIVAYF